MGKDLHLSFEQQAQITRSAFAIHDPQTFSARVRQRLEAEPELGPGVIYRTCRAVQRELFQPPPDRTENGNHRPQLFRKIIR